MPNPTRPTTVDLSAFHGPLRYWFQEYKRDLPWRRLSESAYAVWVSEIMLQQTQVVTVIPYFERWMERFPTAGDLSMADLDEVLQHWSGLGYYARGRNLHRAAKIVMEQFAGVIPSDPKELQKLPGIGKYTSGAILSIAYNRPEPLVDTNVIRVLSRVFALDGDPKSSSVCQIIWQLATNLVPLESASDHNQALMELGAMLCVPVDPGCDRCPLLSVCTAGNSDDPTKWPQISPGRATISQRHVSAIIEHDGKFLMIQRPPHGLWGGLWEFPRRVANSGESVSQCVRRAALEVVGLQVEVLDTVGIVKHAVTHHKITLTGVRAKWSSGEPIANDCAAYRWLSKEELGSVPTSSPQSLIIKKLQLEL